MASTVPAVAKKAGHGAIPFSLGMSLVTLGVVYGDIGTSPLYVMKAIVAGNGGLASVSQDMIIGAVSLIMWTVMLITTVKYVLVAMRADNHNEGGIFALYSLVRRCGKWLILPAMIGGAALLADGILTPAVTVTTAIEGLRTIEVGHSFLGDTPTIVVLITIVILCALFLLQRAGTSSIGRMFGPVMCVWFLFLAVTGAINLVGNLDMLRALNPLRGVMFLFGPLNKAGFAVLGFVFLATTGAEALYSDMGHVGRSNIYASWPFVVFCLFLNYLGQGAWIVANAGNAELAATAELNPFFEMMPVDIRAFAVVLSAVAGLIASQALITGSFTLVSEATRLNLLPHLRVTYPSQTKGQLYIPMVNTVMWIGCIGVVLLFKTSYNMEAAYGLAITLTMLMTTLLLTVYLSRVRRHTGLAVIFACFFMALEGAFFLSSLSKFFHGGYVTILMAAVIFFIMFVWRRGSAIERSQSVFLPVARYIPQLRRLSDDDTIPMLADNLVFLTNDASSDMLDRDILYSILDKRPKRARCYFFVTVRVTDEPFTHAYTVNDFGTDFVFKCTLHLGFKVNQRVNAYLRQVVGDLVRSEEMAPQPIRYSIYRDPGSIGDFRFVMLRKLLTPETELSGEDRTVMSVKYAIRRICGSPAQWYGLATSGVLFEYVPLFSRMAPVTVLERVPLSLSSDLAAEEGDDEDDILSLDLADEMADVIADTEANVIGGEESADRTGVHPKVVFDEEGRPVRIERPGHRGHRHGRGRN
ncbi:putative potassium transport system protein kup [Granulimonas faecalis]|uniref:Probable potassium transport system protein Kup n=1 Tax=Granulimonas faecalis TaxID=2894155 RepID=A0AAV5B2W7_9ACTN|nr:MULTISPECIES: KUP/HAK/KT family potassium transporter [Coriobacteriia]MBF0599812.1 KUP/HAK/KT family potassium transporter [Atopobiaceae bacterium FL090493]GJM54993.1 putative potassium transport system protein kup [Granulimonas faecalis]